MNLAHATATEEFSARGSTRIFTQMPNSSAERDIVDRTVSEVLRAAPREQTDPSASMSNDVLLTSLPQDVAKVINIPQAFRPISLRGRAINTLQEWEGIVDQVGDEGFEARLRDLTDTSHSPEYAWIPIDEVDPKDLDRVKPGAVFHLIVGFCRRGGGRKRETELYFRRHLPSAKAVTTEVADLLDFFEDHVA